MKYDVKRLNSTLEMIKGAFNWGIWGHWISAPGLARIFDKEDGYKYIIKALTLLQCPQKHTILNGTFLSTKPGIHIYTPCFKAEYWEKIVEIKKEVPIVKLVRSKQSSNNTPCHCYQLLTGSQIIPVYSEIKYFEGSPEEAPFDYEYYKSKII